MEKRIYLPLSSTNRKLYINEERIQSRALDLEEFLNGNKYMNSREFSEKVLFSQEIKNNNTIEGYNDDVGLVYDIVKNNLKIEDKKKMQRIKNLYNGYRYILQGKNINKQTLKELYKILSKELLSKYDIQNMGEYYRKGAVEIYYSSSLATPPDEGVPYEEIEKYMNEYFDYANSNNTDKSLTGHFIKSQIMHFQFVNIHPYFDINGRTSRTTSMWHLLNNNAYPYIIFNRGISLNKSVYYKVIREVKMYSNVTFFINYMLDNVRIELEKEYIIDMIKSQTNGLSAVDYQTLYYLLSMRGLKTVKDFISFYNNHNDKKTVLEIYRTMIEPLIDKNIIVKIRNTNGKIKADDPNFVFELNKSMYENDPNKIKKLVL